MPTPVSGPDGAEAKTYWKEGATMTSVSPQQVFRPSKIGWSPAGVDCLACPCCGGDYVHFTGVQVGSRKEEDGPATLIFVTEKGVITTRPPAVEYSDRRTWIELLFWCEDGCRGKLVLAQHKGSTQVTLDVAA